MSETKAAFAERTIRSLKNILYRYMEDFGYKYIHKLPQFIITLSSRRNSSIDMRPNTVKNCDLMSNLYSKPLREFKRPTFKIGDRVRISKYDLPFRIGYKPQFTREVFEIVAIAKRKPPTYKIKDEQGEVIQGNFHQKELIKVIQQWLHLQRSSRVQHCWRHKGSLATMLSLYLKAKGRRLYNNWTVHELSDIK